jgi:alkylhydroperoxidase family enzyme
MDTYLPPVEQPRGLMMKLGYALTRKRFGRVLTPLKVHSARLPLAFGSWYAKISRLDEKVSLPTDLALLIRQQVARINVCEFCIDIGRWEALRRSLAEAKLDALDQYQTSPVFSDAERVALDYATKLTRDKRVDLGTFQRLAEHFSDVAICEIVWLVASEHVYNMTNIGLNIHSDGLCSVPGTREATAGA